MERHLAATLSIAGPGPLASRGRIDFLKFLQPAAGWTEVALLLCLLSRLIAGGASRSSPLGDPLKGHRQLPEETSGLLLLTDCEI